MLVVTRKPGESIRIGENVLLTVVHLGRGRVGLGFEAPQAVRIRRETVAIDAPLSVRFEISERQKAAEYSNSLELC